MIDLTSKNIGNISAENFEILKNLIQKYSPVLELIKDKDYLPHLAYVFEIGIEHLKPNNEITSEWKTWTMLVVKGLFETGKIREKGDIIVEINKFLEYYKSEYEKYSEDTISASEIDKNLGFVNTYLK